MGMASAGTDFGRFRADLDRIQSAIREQGLDGWLIFDLHARNPVATELLGHGDYSRRYFVLIPADGDPIAVTHGIEQGPWEKWSWEKKVYVGWKQLDEIVAPLVQGKKLAMEYSPRGAVPAADMVPAGIVEMIRHHGGVVVSSGELVSLFYSAWSGEGLASHRRTAAILAQVAQAQLTRLGREVGAGARVTEGDLKAWVLADLEERGAAVGADCIAANGVNAANPHYDAPVGGGAVFQKGDVVLLDLWAKEAEDAIYADQTWMGYLGTTVPERVAELFAVIRDARDAGVRLVQQRWEAGQDVAGYEVDDAVRAVVRSRGYEDRFIHRTGHSIDTDTHGMGPNIDNLETHETRKLLPGVGFSVEPGLYIPGDIGLRTEIDVYMAEDGPEVTTPDPQSEVRALLPG